MEKINYREFNNPKEVSLGNIKKEFGKVTSIELHFKDAGIEYNFKLCYPHKPMKYGTGNSISIEWDNLREEMSIAQISRIVVAKASKSTSISFQRYDDIEVNIVCKEVTSLP